MEISVSGSEHDVVISLHGAFLFNSHQHFRSILTEHLERNEGQDRLVFDLRQTDQIDSAGLGMLLLARQSAAERKRTIVLRGARGQVQRMLAISKFETLFTVEP